MNWRRLRWATVLAPILYVMGLELVEDYVLETGFSRWTAHVLTFGAIAVGAVIVSTYVFRTVGRVEERLRQQNRDLAALNAIAGVVSGSLELDEVLGQALGKVVEVTETDAAEIFLLDEAGQNLVSRSHKGYEAEALSEVSSFAVGEGIPGLVAQTGAPLVVADLVSDRRFKRRGLLRLGFRTMASAPLRAQDRVVGVLSVLDRRRPFAEPQLTLLTAIANQIGLAVENARLYRRVHHTADYLNALIESSGDAMITTDLQGHILTWNRGAEAIYGWSRQQAVGEILPMVPPDQRQEANEWLARLGAGETITNLEVQRRHKDGHLLDVVVTISPLRDEAQRMVGALGVSKDLTELKRLQRALMAHQRSLAVLEERERIGMDLHDGAIQSLYSVGLRLESCLPLLDSDPQEVSARLERAADDVAQIIKQIRNYIFGLRTLRLHQGGLREGLEELAQELRAHTMMRVKVAVEGRAEEALGQLSEEARTDLFLVAREALTNILRHARATEAHVGLSADGEGLRLVIRDDGLGFHPGRAGRAPGRGLHNMAERAHLLGARLRIESRPGHGSQIELAVPLSREVGHA